MKLAKAALLWPLRCTSNVVKRDFLKHGLSVSLAFSFRNEVLSSIKQFLLLQNIPHVEPSVSTNHDGNNTELPYGLLLI